jgi:uncharacterized surface protein with fasciclin (FAS1) repeats
MRKLIIALLGAATAAAVAAAPASAEREDKTILDKVIELSGASGFDDVSGDFDILREAVLVTGLDEALGGKGQYTVFAPTDQAFLDLTGEASEEDAFNGVAALGVPAVRQVLKYHVTPGRKGAKQVVQAKRISTLLRDAEIRKERGSTELRDEIGRTVNVAVPNAG